MTSTIRRQPLRTLTLLSLVALIAGCGSAYQSAAVRETGADGTRVRVLALTPETVLVANRAPHAPPRQLPAAFLATAGSGGTRGAGALPDAVTPAVAPVAAIAPTRLPPPPSDPAYRIGVGDVVILATPQTAGGSVVELTGLLAAQTRRQGYTVQDDGAIAVPDVGRVRIGGLTLEEAEAEVFQRLVAHQIEPSFSLELAEFNARKVAIGGAVARPGVAPVTLSPLTLDAALAGVGGVTAAADTATIRLYRGGQLYQIPVVEFGRRADLQKLRLTDGDSVFVDTDYDLVRAQAWFGEQITLAGLRQQARATALAELQAEVGLRRAALDESRQNFRDRLELGAEVRDYAYLTGEVVRQARFALPFGQPASLADALFDAGGGIASGTGNPRQIYVLRGAPDPREFGGITAWHLDAGNAAMLMLATRFELRPDDVIFVAEQPVTRWHRVVQQITPSLLTTPISAAAN